jgi:hypothetical protein
MHGLLMHGYVRVVKERQEGLEHKPWKVIELPMIKPADSISCAGSEGD